MKGAFLVVLAATTIVSHVVLPGPGGSSRSAWRSAAAAQTPAEAVDCEGPVGDAEPGTPEWQARDANNMYCAEQRHLDKAAHPLNLSPPDEPGADAYREPERHDGTRFRYDTTTIGGLAAEVYRPCAPGSCEHLPEGLTTFEPPYPAVVTFHGGASRKELHWWSSQSLAEAGYLVIAYDSAGVGPETEEAEAILRWLFRREDPLAADFDGERLGIAGHSAGGVLVSSFGQMDPRVDAIVSWDRAQSTVLPEDLPFDTPSLFMFADYNCQQVPVCQPEPYTERPDPDGPGNKGRDFQIVRDAGVDTMQVALRAATHLDWVPSDLSGNRWAEIVTVYYTLAWFDRYVRGPDEPALAHDAYRRLTATTFDDSADRHHISQGHYDPARAAAAGDPYAGNVPYAIAGREVANRLSFYFLSKCFLTVPGSTARATSDDIRANGCRVPAAAPQPPGEPPRDVTGPTPGGGLPATGAGAAGIAAVLVLAAAMFRQRRPAVRRPLGGPEGTGCRSIAIVTAVALSAVLLPAHPARGTTQEDRTAGSELPPGCDPGRPAVVHRAGAVPVPEQPEDRPIPCTTFTGPAIEAATAGVTSTGTVFFGSIDQFPSDVRTIVKPSVLARSSNQGADWEVVVPGGLPISPHGSLSSWMSVEPVTDRLWYATPTAPCGATVSWSDDEGETWATNPNIGCPAQGAAVLIEGPAPEGTPEPEGYPHVVYYCANSQDGTESVLACHRSRDGGRTFRFVGSTPDPVPAEEGCEPTNLRRTRPGEVAPDGVLYFPTWSCDHDELGLAISDDQGASWTTRHVHDVAVEDLYPPAMAIDTAGNLFLGYKGADGLPYVTVSTDRGDTWGEPMMLAPPGVDGIRRLGIVARDPGHILVSYLGSTDGGDSFNAYMTESRTAAGEEPTFVSAAVNDPSTPVNLAENEETFGDRTQFLRGHIAGDGTPWAAFHCFDTDLCPGQRRGIAAQLHRPQTIRRPPGATATQDRSDTAGTLPATGGGAAAFAIGVLLLARRRRES